MIKTQLISTLDIICPMCNQRQKMEYSLESMVWYPIPGFCCDIMRNGDSTEWNRLLDRAVKQALN